MFFPSNHDNAVKIEQGDRRYTMHECADDFVGDTKYFKELLEYCEDPANARTFFDYPKSYDLTGVNLRNRPITEAYKEMKKASMPFEYSFLESMIEKHGRKPVYFASSGLFKEFQEWKSLNNVSIDVNALTFSKKISRVSRDAKINIIEQFRTKKGNGFRIDFEGLREYMIGMGFIEEIEFRLIEKKYDVINGDKIWRKRK
jgi:hypothetical protein